MKTVNGLLACSPVSRDFKPDIKTNSGFGTMKQTIELLELHIVLDSDSGYMEGDFVYVNGGSFDRSLWAKEILSLEGKPVILVPETEIKIVKKLGEKDDSVHAPQQTSLEGT